MVVAGPSAFERELSATVSMAMIESKLTDMCVSVSNSVDGFVHSESPEMLLMLAGLVLYSNVGAV